MADDRCEPCQSASSCRRGKRGLNTKIHLAVDAHGMPVRILITEGTRADCSQAKHLIEGIDAEYLLADKGYDSDKIIEKAVRTTRIAGGLGSPIRACYSLAP